MKEKLQRKKKNLEHHNRFHNLDLIPLFDSIHSPMKLSISFNAAREKVFNLCFQLT